MARIGVTPINSGLFARLSVPICSALALEGHEVSAGRACTAVLAGVGETWVFEIAFFAHKALRALAGVVVRVESHTRRTILAGVRVAGIGLKLTVLTFEEPFALAGVKIVSNGLASAAVLTWVRLT